MFSRGGGIFSRRTNQTQDVRVYSHGGPIVRRSTPCQPAAPAPLQTVRTSHSDEATQISPEPDCEGPPGERRESRGTCAIQLEPRHWPARRGALCVAGRR
eukprot:8527434-Pyramimonas_sp.AAC.1